MPPLCRRGDGLRATLTLSGGTLLCIGPNVKLFIVSVLSVVTEVVEYGFKDWIESFVLFVE
jgi:hypothetical protein